MFTVTMTVQGSPVDFYARDENHVLAYAMDYAREHGSFSGMEDWHEYSVREWIRRELENERVLDLYISGPEGHEFTVRPESARDGSE